MDSDTQVMTEQPSVSQPDYADLAAQGNEVAIAQEIASMWETNRSMKLSVKDSQKELQKLSRTLGEALFFMKVLLAKPGRNGKWSEFLRERKISRTSGDRLVAAYERSLSPNANCTDGAIQSLTQGEVRKLCSAVWSRVSRRLTTSESLYWFIRDFVLVSGARHELRENGILVFESAVEEDVESPSVATASTVDGEAAAVADAGSSDAVCPEGMKNGGQKTTTREAGGIRPGNVNCRRRGQPPPQPA